MLLRPKRKFLLLAVSASLTVIGAILLASCGASGDSEATSNASVVNAINILDKAGLHGIDDSINKDKTVPASARTTALQLQAVTQLTEWPDDFEDEAEALAGIFADLAKALEGDTPDLTKAGEAAAKAHDAQHDFSHELWEHLYKEAGVSTGAAAGGH